MPRQVRPRTAEHDPADVMVTVFPPACTDRWEAAREDRR